MSAPKDKKGNEIKVQDRVVYISPNRSKTSHAAVVDSIGADGTLSGIRISRNGAYRSLSAADVITGYDLELVRTTYQEPSTSAQGMNAGPLPHPPKDYIKYSSGGAPSAGRRRKTKKSKRRQRKTRRSRK